MIDRCAALYIVENVQPKAEEYADEKTIAQASLAITHAGWVLARLPVRCLWINRDDWIWQPHANGDADTYPDASTDKAGPHLWV
jgi:hypothetical protein